MALACEILPGPAANSGGQTMVLIVECKKMAVLNVMDEKREPSSAKICGKVVLSSESMRCSGEHCCGNSLFRR